MDDKTADDGFMLNFCSVMLGLCEKYASPADKVGTFAPCALVGLHSWFHNFRVSPSFPQISGMLLSRSMCLLVILGEMAAKV